MGLLDDAIREHLELKRLRGADPGLVAQEEHEAFGPVRGGVAARATAEDGTPDDFDEQPVESVTWMDDDLTPESRSDAQTDDTQTDDARGFSSIGQETAELDMRAVLEQEPDRAHSSVDDHDSASIGRGNDDAHDESSDVPHTIPEQEQLFKQRPSRDFGFDE